MGTIRRSGWAGMYNNGAGVTGGKGGSVHEYSTWNTFRDTLWALEGNTSPMIIRYTGASATIPDIAFYFEGLFNKTIEHSAGQNLHGGEFRLLDSENIIVRNMSKTGPYTTRSYREANGIQSALDYFTLTRCTGVIIDHCTGNGEDVFDFDAGVDGWGDYGATSDFLTIQYNKIWGVNRAHLLGNTPAQVPDPDFTKAKMTFAYNWYKNVANRAPQARWGKPHILSNLYDWEEPAFRDEDGDRISVAGRPTTVYALSIRYYTQLVSEGNCYKNGGRLITDQAAEFGDTLRDSGAISLDDYINPVGWASSNSPNYFNFINIRPEKVTWNPRTEPNYPYNIPLLNAETEVEPYVRANAGAILNLSSHTLTVSVVGSGETNRTGNSTWTNWDEITVVATPANGFTVQWRLGSVDGTLLSTSEAYTFVMPQANLNLVAVFVAEGGGGEPTVPSPSGKIRGKMRKP